MDRDIYNEDGVGGIEAELGLDVRKAGLAMHALAHQAPDFPVRTSPSEPIRPKELNLAEIFPALV